MRYSFYGISLAMCPIVCWVDGPIPTGPMVLLCSNPVHDGIAKLHVFILHVDQSPQYPASFREFAVLHPSEEVEIFAN